MRALKSFVCTFSLVGNFAFSYYGEVSLSVTQSPPLNFDQTSNSHTFTSYSSQLSLGEVKILDSLFFTQTIQVIRIDKSQYGFLDQAQNDLHTKSSIEIDLTANSLLNYQSGQYSASVAFLYPVTNNFVEQYGFDTSHAVDFYNKSTIIGLSYKFLKEYRPESYFLDFDFTVKNRPSNVRAHELSLFYEQILTERFKLRVKPFIINRPKERPDALGGEVLLAYAPFESHVLKLKALYAREDKTQSLKNERGYFKLFSANLAWDYEFSYSTLLGLSYTYQSEDEDNPRNLTSRTLGLDSVGAFFEKKIASYTVKLTGDYSRSNLNSNFWGTTLSLRRDI